MSSLINLPHCRKYHIVKIIFVSSHLKHNSCFTVRRRKTKLCGAVEPPADLLSLLPTLVDRHTGIVTVLAEVPRDPSEPPLPLVFRAQLANSQFRGKDSEPVTVASGKGMTPDASRSSALGEAVERYGSLPWNPGLQTRSAAQDLDGPCYSPHDLVSYRPDQYERLPYARWAPDVVMDWLPARRLATSGSPRVWVPALGSYLDYQVPRRREFFFPATSNGLAAGPTLAHAILSGLLELIERDAFLLAWFGRQPGHAVDPFDCGDADVAALARSYDRRGVHLRLIQLPVDTPATVCVALGIDQRPAADRPAAVIGLGADLNPALATRKAILEVGQVRPALRARLRDSQVHQRLAELVADPSCVAELDDHDLLYAHPAHLQELSHWLTAPAGASAPGLGPASPAEQVAVLVDALLAVGVPVCYLNLTPPDLAALGLSVVRVHAPGLQPIHFGADEARLAGPRLRPIADDLNLFPHPLA
jgi:ribosomal protein S12 methylthiotransferase accessory factor